jgi:protein-disulfide isomerase
MKTDPKGRDWERIERILLVVLTLAALSSTMFVVRREIVAQRVELPYQLRTKPEFVDEWSRVLPLSSTLSVGPSDKYHLLIVSDYECPACARFESTRPQLDSLGLTLHIIHLPLKQHRFSRASAAAAKCAEAQGRFSEMHSALFSQQDSIGLLPFTELARRAGVKDLQGFELCIHARETNAFIDSSLSAAKKLGAHATPTLILNGWRYPHPPSVSTLRVDLESVRKGRPPLGDALPHDK